MTHTTLQDEVSRLMLNGLHLQAIDIITAEIKEKPGNPELYTLRSQNLLKLEKFKEASSDAARAIEFGGGAEAHLVHGKSLFNLGKYVESLDTFNKGKSKAGSELGRFDQFGQWMSWCTDRIKKLELQGKVEGSNIEAKDTKMEKQEPAVATAAANAMPVPKIKHDWYQTETHVVITILIKKQKKEDVKVEFTETTVGVTAPLPSGSEYSLQLDTCHPINPSESSFKVLPSKIEVKVKKVTSIHWLSLEGDGAAPKHKKLPSEGGTSASTGSTSYPSSSTKKHDWNKIEADIKAEEENEKLEGDAALNQLFQKIYGQGSEETRRAMNKSFMESGGTVLSTNWKEVAGSKVDVKPPDGVEFKKWNQ